MLDEMGETMREADWREPWSAELQEFSFSLAGILLAAGLCVANTPTDHPVPSIFEPHSTPSGGRSVICLISSSGSLG